MKRLLTWLGLTLVVFVLFMALGVGIAVFPAFTATILVLIVCGCIARLFMWYY